MEYKVISAFKALEGNTHTHKGNDNSVIFVCVKDQRPQNTARQASSNTILVSEYATGLTKGQDGMSLFVKHTALDTRAGQNGGKHADLLHMS